MSYTLGQYNKSKDVADDDSFMTEIRSGIVSRKETNPDSGASGGSSLIFENECIRIDDGLETTNYYYFHGKIKRMDSEQKINIKLINYNSTDDTEQFIKTITIAEGNVDEWVDVEFIFNPYIRFDTILFELKRTATDYVIGPRWVKIIYEELSIINNIITSKIGGVNKLIKIGVQSRPGMIMCINGEEIHLPRTGIYEIRDGSIMINFFSVITAAAYAGLDAVIEAVNAEWAAAADKEDVLSRCLYSESKTRKIDSFTLDYLREE